VLPWRLDQQLALTAPDAQSTVPALRLPSVSLVGPILILERWSASQALTQRAVCGSVTCMQLSGPYQILQSDSRLQMAAVTCLQLDLDLSGPFGGFEDYSSFRLKLPHSPRPPIHSIAGHWDRS
jgi:hypothetical protein